MSLRNRIWGAALGAALLGGAGLAAAPAQAAYIVTLTQLGSNVVATGHGTIDLIGLSFFSPEANPALVYPSGAAIVTGPATPTGEDGYTGFNGPTSFGSGNLTPASSGSGDPIGIVGNPSVFGISILYVPAGYVSGTALLDTATYDNATFASLGVTSGTYVWTWNSSGLPDDSFTLQIGTASVPEPSGLALLALPLGLLMLGARRRPGRTRGVSARR